MAVSSDCSTCHQFSVIWLFDVGRLLPVLIYFRDSVIDVCREFRLIALGINKRLPFLSHRD
jgi:hypothetical protein